MFIYLQFTSDSKRLRTTSGDCYELEAAATVSGASTPTHVDYSPLQVTSYICQHWCIKSARNLPFLSCDTL